MKVFLGFLGAFGILCIVLAGSILTCWGLLLLLRYLFVSVGPINMLMLIIGFGLVLVLLVELLSKLLLEV